MFYQNNKTVWSGYISIKPTRFDTKPAYNIHVRKHYCQIWFNVIVRDKMGEKYHTVGTVSKVNRKNRRKRHNLYS
jgi:hypothetical protein